MINLIVNLLTLVSVACIISFGPWLHRQYQDRLERPETRQETRRSYRNIVVGLLCVTGLFGRLYYHPDKQVIILGWLDAALVFSPIVSAIFLSFHYIRTAPRTKERR